MAAVAAAVAAYSSSKKAPMPEGEGEGEARPSGSRLSGVWDECVGEAMSLSSKWAWSADMVAQASTY